jgi:hypothetical protein
MMAALAALTLGGWASHVAEKLHRYGKTSYGRNPWTIEAAINVLSIASHIERARVEIDGSITSVYRSVEVNERVPGASKTSRHMQGLAADIKPTAMSPESAARKLLRLAKQGDLGRVRMVIWEPTWVHVDWFSHDEAQAAVAFRKLEGDKYVQLT